MSENTGCLPTRQPLPKTNLSVGIPELTPTDIMEQELKWLKVELRMFQRDNEELHDIVEELLDANP